MTFSRLEAFSTKLLELTYSEVAQATTSSMAASMHSTQHMDTVCSNTFMAMKVMILCMEPTKPRMSSNGEEKETIRSMEVMVPVPYKYSTATKETTSYILAQWHKVT